MNISISNLNHRIIWNEVWDRLALPVQSELWEFLIDIKEIPLIDATYLSKLIMAASP